MRDWKLGMIARCDNGGLGIESVEFYRHLKPDRMLIVHGGYQNAPEKYAACPAQVHCGLMPSDHDLSEFLTGLDSVLVNETPYNWRLFELARERRIRTVMKVNYEWLEDRDRPDCYVLPNRWHVEDVPGTEGVDKFVIGLPVDLIRFRFHQRHKAKTFLHVVGHNAGHDRNGTKIVAEALRHSKSDYKLLVTSQLPRRRIPAFDDPRVVMLDEDVPDNARLYAQADVLVLPRRYGGQSLVMEEAAACGLPMITTDMSPQDELFRHSAVFLPLSDVGEVTIKKPVQWADVDPRVLAGVIDELAAQDENGHLALLSASAPLAVYERSWLPWVDVLRPR